MNGLPISRTYLEIRFQFRDGHVGLLLEQSAAERRSEGDADANKRQLKGNHRHRIFAEETTFRSVVRDKRC